ncbi:hypothetical protein QAD02_017258 [Eretmocerus hayati]|uniref:Uncharacterized protein n=1 Tax=Eretmocerus hayati TaxID=131215 RepID=A0ACC2PDB8_9HYME|nr:hypothetical protein QAD02_017258 [Eretmocerus hayati]
MIWAQRRDGSRFMQYEHHVRSKFGFCQSGNCRRAELWEVKRVQIYRLGDCDIGSGSVLPVVAQIQYARRSTCDDGPPRNSDSVAGRWTHCQTANAGQKRDYGLGGVEPMRCGSSGQWRRSLNWPQDIAGRRSWSQDGGCRAGRKRATLRYILQQTNACKRCGATCVCLRPWRAARGCDRRAATDRPVQAALALM